MKYSATAAIIGTGFLAGFAHGQATFSQVAAPGYTVASANAISSDGTTVIGRVGLTPPYGVYKKTAAGFVVLAGQTAGMSNLPVSISGDGSVVGGYTFTPGDTTTYKSTISLNGGALLKVYSGLYTNAISDNGAVVANVTGYIPVDGYGTRIYERSTNHFALLNPPFPSTDYSQFDQLWVYGLNGDGTIAVGSIDNNNGNIDAMVWDITITNSALSATACDRSAAGQDEWHGGGHERRRQHDCGV